MRGNSHTEHRHKCKSKKCGVIWQHDPRQCLTQHQHDQAHICPTCGTEQRTIFYGEEKAVVRHSGFVTEWGDIPLPPHVGFGGGSCSDDPEFERLLATNDDEQMATYMAKQFMTMSPPAQRAAFNMMKQFKDDPGHPAGLIWKKLEGKKVLDKYQAESVGLWT